MNANASTSPADPPQLLVASGITKAYPGVQALDNVALRVAAGEVLCVVGENGAGKSTLMKILAGVSARDSGEILLDGQPVDFPSVRDAEAAGITLIHQELSLAQNLNVAANIFLGREPTRAGPLRLLDRRIDDDAARACRTVGLAVSPRAIVGELSIGQQQLVEIARALSLQSRLLIMDEPTSSLSQSDADRLFGVIRDLKRQGVAILYISHRLPEVQAIADRVTVLRDGRNAGELAKADISHAAMVRLMVGRDLKQFFVRGHHAAEQPSGTSTVQSRVLQVTGLRLIRQQPPIDFHVHAGEVVALAGLVGAGRTELAQALFGVRQPIEGKIEIDGQPRRIRSPADAIAAGVFLVPEDRRIEGLILSDSVRRNIVLPSLGMTSRGALLSPSRERSLAQQLCQRLNVRVSDIERPVALLSGGNQQKVVLAKWLPREPRVLILDEPTRGVDVGAKGEIYAIIDQLAARGVGILMISSDLEEILGIGDRVLVMHQKALVGELPRHAMTEQAIMHLATGGERAA